MDADAEALHMDRASLNELMGERVLLTGELNWDRQSVTASQIELASWKLMQRRVREVGRYVTAVLALKKCVVTGKMRVSWAEIRAEKMLDKPYKLRLF